jgi:RNA polymerase sigma factor (sigma-70 family)
MRRVDPSVIIKHGDIVEVVPISQIHGGVAETALRHRTRLLDFIRRRVGTDEDAEDIVQDVFYQFLSNYSVAQPIEQLSAWLYTVARNRIVDWYRKRKHKSQPPTDEETGLPLNLEEILFDPSGEPDRVMFRGAVWEALADALEELPGEQSEVFVMHELEGRSFKEIAEITGENINTLLSRKRYAVLALREALQDMYNEL